MRDTTAFLRDPAVYTAGAGLAHGDFYRVSVPGYRIHVITDPQLAERVMVSEGHHFEKSRIYWRELRRVVGEAMGSLEGPRWAYLRRIQQPFFTPRRVQQYMPVAEAVTTRAMERLAARARTEVTVDLIELLAAMNCRLLLSAVFARPIEDEASQIARRIADGEATIAWRSKFPWRPLTAWLTGANQRARRHKAFFGAYAERVRSTNTEAPDPGLVGPLLRVHDDDEAPRFPDTLLRNEIIVHLGAGTETQAVAEGWTLYLLARNPGILEAVRAEVEQVCAGGPAGIEELARLELTTRVVRESLRLYPPSYALVRDCVQPTDLNGTRLRRGDVAFVSVCGLHRSPRTWENPGRFDPGRFDAENAPEIHKYQYLPFGAGRHACIGQHLALPCLVLAIAQFVQRFDWRIDGDLQPVGLATLKPRGGLMATVARRS